ncbi:helix-turn-helix domain-containing protein [Aliikangiella coralliicola]|uniref:Helix-turn-helix transcriptional regulator n=1 Tax=Aliikangiella coralliicola TaxID=2592383 RepID=A0A545UFN6_9GAMM|nr:AraC family transcriptional regulator [Aliikangiella coralliicola]TQV88277.1 helix-turn-helix transcriptional regulator [Aliikangiella coralliicola]
MTFYETELRRIRKQVYSNQQQLDLVIGIKKLIDANYDSDLNLDMLSFHRFISKYYLLRLFKRYFGLTPKQYLIDKRIEKSKEFLRAGTSVTQTCFAVGFKSLGSFSVLFKEKIGISPKQYQKEQLSRSKLNSNHI